MTSDSHQLFNSASSAKCTAWLSGLLSPSPPQNRVEGGTGCTTRVTPGPLSSPQGQEHLAVPSLLQTPSEHAHLEDPYAPSAQPSLRPDVHRSARGPRGHSLWPVGRVNASLDLWDPWSNLRSGVQCASERAGAELSGPALPAQPHHKGATGLPSEVLNNDTRQGCPREAKWLAHSDGVMGKSEGRRERGRQEGWKACNKPRWL